MKYTISGTNIQVTEGLKNAIIKKLGKLEKYFSDDTEIVITCGFVRKQQIIEVTIPIKNAFIRAEEHADNMHTAIDQVTDTLERQLLKHKKKLIKRHRHHGTFRQNFVEEYHEDDENIDIVRSKRFPVKPMDAEEACMEMELLGHSFFVFRDRETDELNVVYKRKDGQFGLIAPE